MSTSFFPTRRWHGQQAMPQPDPRLFTPQLPRQFPRPLAVVLGLVLAALCQVTSAADDDRRLAAAREALRRTQEALQTAQQTVAKLQNEQAALTQDKARLEAALAAAQGQVTARQREAAALRVQTAQDGSAAQSERERLQAELAQQRAGREAAEHKLDATVQALNASRSELGDQRRTTASVTALLERSVKALGDAEAKNRKLLDLGLQAVEAWRHATPEAFRARDEPFLGLADVRLENQAEVLRAGLDAQRLGH
jgi:chromosome segregation ATPase